MAKSVWGCSFWIFFFLALFKANGQQTSSTESKRKASEYFCVAQCLGMLGSDRPSQACYDENAKMVMKTNKQCDSQSYAKINDCCKDFPMDIMPPPANETESKVCKDMAKGVSMDEFLNYYIMTGPMNTAGRFEFGNQGTEIAKRYGKQLCYMECVFDKKKLLKEGLIEFQAAKKEFENAANGTTWKNLVANAYIACQYILAGNSNIARSVFVTLDGGNNKECKTTPGILYQCMKRHMIVNCPATQKATSPPPVCKDIDYYSYQCDPFK